LRLINANGIRQNQRCAGGGLNVEVFKPDVEVFKPDVEVFKPNVEV